MLILSDKTFAKHLDENEPMLVMFTAKFAGPCALAEPMFEEARGRRGNQVKFASFDLDGNSKVPNRYGVRSIPCFILFIDGKPVDAVAGAVPTERILEMLKDV
jgi:thioredoxin-like negative regulator of GroEL